jgi:hypothetical protein
MVVAKVERTLHAMGCLHENTQPISVTAASDCSSLRQTVSESAR